MRVSYGWRWLGLGVLLGAVSAGEAVGPGLIVEPAHVKAGRINAGEKKVLRFRMRNVGPRPLKIRSVEGDCGCLTAEYPRQLAAGAKAEIKAHLEALPLWAGPTHRGLTVITDDPVQPRLRLRVSADVVPHLAVEPRGQVVVPVQPGAAARREIRLTPRAGSRLRITKAVSDTSLVKAVLVPPAAGDRSRTYRLKLTLGPHAQPGDFGGTVHLTTTQRDVEDWPITVRGQAASGPVVIPQRVLLPIVRREEAAGNLARLRVFNRSGAIRVLSVETGTPRLKAEVEPTATNRSHRVIVRASGRLSPGTLATTLRIRTDDARFPVVSVPFHATVQ